MTNEKWAAVTGAASGIGAATVLALKAKGFKVLGIDRSEGAPNVDRFLRADLSSAKDIQALVDQVDVPLDALCNVAGVPPTAGVMLTMKVNFFGLRALTEALIPKLADNASIVNVGSLAGVGWSQRMSVIKACLDTPSLDQAEQFVSTYGITDESSYYVTKEALIVWTMQSWNRWRDRGIRMNSVSPGPVMTPIHKDFMESLGKRTSEDASKVKRPATPEEIAPVIAFLCSQESSWIRATNIAADDGLSSAGQAERFGF